MNKTPRLLELYWAIEEGKLSLEEDEMHSFYTIEFGKEKVYHTLSSRALLEHYSAYLDETPKDLIYFS